MDKKLTRFGAGRLKFAAVATACLIGVLALPAIASAAAPFASQYPALGATLRVKPTVIYVDVVQAGLNASTGKITVDGVTQPTAVLKGTGTGSWSAVETLGTNGLYKVTWTWTAVAGPVKFTLRAAPTASALTTTTAPHVVVATIKTSAGVTLSTTWNYTIVDQQPVVVVPPVSGFNNLTCTTASTCHIHDVAGYATDNAMGPNCVGCHSGGYAPKHGLTPSLTSMGTAHNALTANIQVKAVECVRCHGSNVGNVLSTNGTLTTSDDIANPAIGADEHRGCLCHTYGEAKTMKSCLDCHAPHGFSQKVEPFNVSGTWVPAGGHNTTMYGVNGALEKWDGTGIKGVVIKDSTNSTITQDWPLPTGGVFWSQVDAIKADPTTDSPDFIFGNGTPGSGSSKVRTDVGWNSVVTCQDCHTGLSGLSGPQGANAGRLTLDPNFPDDWKTAEITSFDPTGMRSIATTAGSSNRFYRKLGSTIWPPEGTTGSSVQNRVKGNINTSITVSEGGFYDETATSSNGYSSGAVEGRFICQKCHKLTSPFQGVGLAGNSRGFRSNNYAYSGFSNEAHMEHHADTINGQANCISCHIGVPHGWKRPRLLVYESDPAPYKVDQFPLNSTIVAKGTTYTNAGNWAYFSNTGAMGWKGSSHLEAINAASTAHKVEAAGVPDEFAPYDAANAAANGSTYFWGAGWSNWSTTSVGNLWHADTNVTIRDVNGAVTSDPQIQNNCNACTATGATHSDPSLSNAPVSGPPLSGTSSREGFTPAITAPVPVSPTNFLAPAWK